jgi:hypothetical protein
MSDCPEEKDPRIAERNLTMRLRRLLKVSGFRQSSGLFPLLSGI